MSIWYCAKELWIIFELCLPDFVAGTGIDDMERLNKYACLERIMD